MRGKRRAFYFTHINIACTAADPGAGASGVDTTTCANISGPAAGFGLGLHTYSASATDKAGNTGTGSTSFTVGVTPPSLCTYTLQLTDGSAKYLALTRSQKQAFDKTVGALCALDLTPIKFGIKPATKASLIAAYKRGVNILAAGGWLTTQQASQLAALASAL